MDWLSIVKAIHERLRTNGFNDISAQIHHAQLSGGTGGEMFTLVLEKLISIKKHQPEVYALIREETEWMIAYAKVIGYWRRPHRSGG
jgi:hypothetical protein